MIRLREAQTDADLEAWIGVRRAVLPNESGGTVALLRAQERPERLLLLAELDGRLAGAGLADRSDVGDRFAVKPRVLPWARRRGVGGALLHALAAHAERFGLDAVTTHLEEPEARGFAERFGFREIDRQVEQVKTLGREEPPPAPPGLELVTIAERPELLRAAHPLACEGYADFALDAPASISLETWLGEEATLPEGSFVALEDGEVVGYSGLLRHDNEGVAEDGLTVVRRDRRLRGLALALKRMELAWAAANGYREVVTWTQQGNGAMRRLNERLGYEYRDVSVTMLAPLPLPSP
jgi:GNAT superfamily N-acetyltransferase